ncbi:MAG: hypothetical protein AAF998_18465 [Bacteroidota bacterium]
MLSKQIRILKESFEVFLVEDRITFLISLPYDVYKVVGINFVVDPGKLNWDTLLLTPWPENTAGNVSLRWHGPGDVFYQSTVALEMSYEMNHGPLGIVAPGGSLAKQPEFWYSGKSYRPVEVEIDSNHRVIHGFYKDVLNKLGTSQEAYTVHVYLYYERTGQ